MKYNVGDKVIVRKDLKVGERVKGTQVLFTGSMGDLIGKTVTIKDVVTNRYHVIEDNDSYYWIDEMFEETSESDVLKQVIISVKDGALKVQHTTNTKKNNVSIQRTGYKIGKIKLDEIDSLIGLLTKLKSEV